MSYTATSPARDLATYLQTGSIGTVGTPTTGTAIAVGMEPPVDAALKLEKCITLYDTGGTDPDPRGTLDRPTVQVRVRGPARDYSAGWAIAQQARDYLLGKNGFTVNSRRYVCIWLEGDVAFLMRDAGDRPIFTFNLRTMREPYIAPTP